MWTLEEAITLIRLWKIDISAKTDWHLGITGSVLYKGQSTKDLDLICYPNNTERSKSTEDLLNTLKTLSLVFHEDRTAEHQHQYNDCKIVYKCSYGFKRIDLFLLA